MKNKPYVFVGKWEKSRRRLYAVTLLVALLISFILYPLSLFGRKCLRNDGSIVQYNMFNGQSHEYSSGQIKRIVIEADTHRYRNSSHMCVQMVFTTDSGKIYIFDYHSFRNDAESEISNWLTAMTNIKRRYNPEIIYYEGTENLDFVVEDRRLTDWEKDLLYQLFEQK